jgi:hypothetical protein
MQQVGTAPAAGDVRRSAPILLAIAGVAGWAAFAWVTLRYLGISRDQWQAQPFLIHYDWHAYAAGAQQLADRSLYRVPLSMGDTPLPIDAFNLPPLAAAEAGPFLVGGVLAGGLAWQAVGAAAVAFAAWAMAFLPRRSWDRALAVAGILVGAYLAVDHVLIPDPQSYWWGLTLGTNNYLVLGLIGGFVVALHRRHDRAAGVLLGLAIATKLWPVTIVAALVRNRSWVALRWAVGLCAVQAIVFAVWLGPDVLPDFARSLLVDDPDAEDIIGVSALRDILPWWPSWAGWVVAGVLLALPVRGHAAIGVGILAGLAVITNLWGHYLPTVVFALGLVATAWLTDARGGRSPRGVAEPESAGHAAAPNVSEHGRTALRG